MVLTNFHAIRCVLWPNAMLRRNTQRCGRMDRLRFYNSPFPSTGGLTPTYGSCTLWRFFSIKFSWKSERTFVHRTWRKKTTIKWYLPILPIKNNSCDGAAMCIAVSITAVQITLSCIRSAIRWRVHDCVSESSSGFNRGSRPIPHIFQRN